MRLRATVLIRPKAGLRDPEGSTIGEALAALGYTGVAGVHVGKVVELDLDAESVAAAEPVVAEMCERILANPVIEDFEFALSEAVARGAGA